MSNGSVPNIALRAYQLWDAAGRPEGRDEEFYFQAEEELRKLLEIEGPNESGEKRTTPMADAIATPETEDETGKQIPPRRHDAGSGANETEDGLDASPEALGTPPKFSPAQSSRTRLKLCRCLTGLIYRRNLEFTPMVKRRWDVFIETVANNGHGFLATMGMADLGHSLQDRTPRSRRYNLMHLMTCLAIRRSHAFAVYVL